MNFWKEILSPWHHRIIQFLKKIKRVSFNWCFSQARSSIVFHSVYGFLADLRNLHALVRLISLQRTFFLTVKQWPSATHLLLTGLWSFTELTSSSLCLNQGKVCFWMLILCTLAAEVWDAEVLGESCKLSYPHAHCEYVAQNKPSLQELSLFVAKIMTLNGSASHV